MASAAIDSEMDIVSWTFANPPEDEERPIYIDPASSSRSLSFSQTRLLVKQLIAGFSKHGVQKDDCVCVVSFNDIHYTPLYLSIIGAGAHFTGANPGYTPRELAHHLRITSAKYILSSAKTLAACLAAAAECNIPSSNIFVLNFQDEEIPEERTSWKRLLECGEKTWVQGEGEVRAKSAAYVSTSGTSGLPKAAVLGHGYLVSQGKFLESIVEKKPETSTVIAIPPFHVFTMPIQHALPLRTGTKAYIMPRFQEADFVDVLTTFKITHAVVVPPIMMTISKRSKEELKSLERIYVGGSCASDGMQQQLYSRLAPEAKIVQVYGMTEVGWATCWWGGGRDATGSVGQPIAGTKLRIMSTAGQVVTKDGITGEVQIYTPHSMQGYLKNPTATAEARTPEGWIRTGDVGYSKDGSWYIIDRTKDLIKVRGWQVSPAEIEAALLEHAEILDAGVIATPAKDGCGEAPFAFVVMTKGAKIDEEEVKRFLGTRLARYKNVEEVEFVEKIPRNPTGKILRRILRDTVVEVPKNPDQIAASEYASALKNLDAYQKSQTCCENAIEAIEAKTKTVVTVSEVEVKVETEVVAAPTKAKRKRDDCSGPVTQIRKWRRLRYSARVGQ